MKNEVFERLIWINRFCANHKVENRATYKKTKNGTAKRLQFVYTRNDKRKHTPFPKKNRNKLPILINQQKGT